MGIFFISDANLVGMAVRGTQGGGDPITLPEIVPLDIPHLSRLSWELGSRVVGDRDSERIGTWKHRGDRWAMELFDVTTNTAILRVRTSVGRERFYGAIRSEVAAALPAIETAPTWRRIE